MNDWYPFDYDNPLACARPSHGTLVWINDEFYNGVTIGVWDGRRWETADGSSDISVSHWMPIDMPDSPK
jgi:hypothetical protein